MFIINYFLHTRLSSENKNFRGIVFICPCHEYKMTETESWHCMSIHQYPSSPTNNRPALYDVRGRLRRNVYAKYINCRLRRGMQSCSKDCTVSPLEELYRQPSRRAAQPAYSKDYTSLREGLHSQPTRKTAQPAYLCHHLGVFYQSLS